MAKGEEETPRLVLDTKIYVEMLSKLVEEINEAKPEDRMDFAFEVTRCLKGLMVSVKGWQSWINSIDQLHSLSIKDYKFFYPKMKKAVIEFLKADIEITKRKLAEAIILYKQLTKEDEPKKKGKSKTTYVS